MKRYFISVLIPCLLFQLCGCYSMQEVGKEDFALVPDYNKLKIITDEREFTFNQGDYSFKNDTISGVGLTLLLKNYYQPFEGKISVYDVENVEIAKMNNLKDTASVTVWTKEKEFVFKYEKSCYSIKNDTIYAKGKYRLINNVEEPFDGNIDLTDVKEIQMEEVDVAGTIAFTAGVLLVLAGLMALYVASTWSIDFSD